VYFAHAPKLVLTGVLPALRPLADRAAALDAEVVLVGAPAVEPPAPAPVADVAGFDVAIVAVEADDVARQLDAAADLLAPGLRRGALVVVASRGPAESLGRCFAVDLGRRSGLDVGRDFHVAGVECSARPDATSGAQEASADVAWTLGPDGAEHVRYLLSRIGAPVLAGAPTR
jgi:hypothetical protein